MKNHLININKIKSTNSRIEKENILKSLENNDEFKDVLRFVFDPLIVTGLAKRKIEKDINLTSTIEIKSLSEAIQYVIDNNTGSSIDIANIQSYLNTIESDDERELAKSILIKDLPIGISRTTLNKVYGKDFIKKYSVMLAGKYVEDKSNFESFALTLKIDGNRISIFNYESGPKFFSRSGKEIDGMVELEEAFKLLPKDMFYDGEVIAINNDNLLSKDLFNLTQTIVRRKGEKKGLEFILFDMLPISEFNDGISKKGYLSRSLDINSLEGLSKTPFIKPVQILYIGEDKSEIPKYLEEVEEMGYEGLMINTLDGFYETKRTKSLLKVKSFHTIDVRCIGIKEDIRGNKCGSITVNYKGFEVDCSGLTHKLKEDFWNNPELVVGKIIEVKYFEESKNSNGGLSLRFPSFVRIREDKNEVSYS